MIERQLKPVTLCVIACCIAAVLRFLWYLYAKPYPIDSDAVIYFGLAKRLIEYGQYAEFVDGRLEPHVYFLPGYAFYIALFLMVQKSFLLSAIANILASALLVPITFFLVRKLFQNTTIALIAAWLCALHPNYVVYGAAVQSENLFPVLFFGALAVLICGKGAASFWRVIVASVLVACACLVRGEGIFYLPVIFLAGFIFRENVSFSELLADRKKLLLMPAIVILILGSWMVRNYETIGVATLSSTSGLNFYLAHNEKGYGWQDYADLVSFLENAETEDGQPIKYGTPESSRYFFSKGLEHLKNEPLSLIKDVALGTLHLYRPSRSVINSTEFPVMAAIKFVAWLGCFALAVLSVFFWRRLPWQGWSVMVLLLSANWFCYAVLFWASPRYRFAMEEVFLIFAAVAIYFLYKKFVLKQ